MSTGNQPKAAFLTSGWRLLSAAALSVCLGATVILGALMQKPDSAAAMGSQDSLLKEMFMVPTRDGILLKTTLFHLPSTTGPGPVLLLRCPLNQARYEIQARQFAEAGYYTVTQDSRGRFGSTGSYPYYSGEGQDSYDTIEWIRQQSWCDGKVGMWGHSNPATVTWMTAAEGVPLDAWAVSAGAPDFYQNQYLGGAYILAMARGGYSADLYGPPPSVGHSPDWSKWYLHLPLDLESVTGYKAPWQISYMVHARKDGYWKRTDATPLIPRFNTTAQHIVGYYDFLCRATVTGFQLMRSRSATAFSRENQQLIIGPWDHGSGDHKEAKINEVDFGPQAYMSMMAVNIDWFDRFLRKTPRTGTPFRHVRYFSMGDNVWREADARPPADSIATPFYLHSDGKANTSHGNGKLDTKRPAKSEREGSFRADPSDPVPANPEFGNEFKDIWGPTDQKLAADRQDVLIYQTPSLGEPVAFAGPLRAELYVSADTPDADWAVRLIDVRPDGFAQPLATGIQRGSSRDSNTNPTPLVPGKVYALNVDLGHAAARILPGHSLRLQIAPSCFPLFERNTNSGEGPTSARAAISTERIWHDAARPSRIWLPVVK